MNIVVLKGRLVRDPELRFTSDQKAVCSFTIAVDRGVKNTDGDTDADFPRITCFGKTAENVSNFLSRGSSVNVVGSIRTNSYKNKNGENVYVTEVFANKVEFLDKYGKKNTANNTSEKNKEDAEVRSDFEEVVAEDLPWNK